MNRYDVIIVGAGIVGMASAYHLKKNNPDKKILAIEKEKGEAQGNTGKSSGMVRNVFHSKTNRLLADTSVSFYLHVYNELEHDLDFKRIGYLWLMNKFQFEKSSFIIRTMLEQGIKIQILEKHDLKKIPGLILQFDDNDKEAEYLNLLNIDKGLISTEKCGQLDPSMLTRHFKEEFEKLGGEILFDVEVEKLIIKPDEDLGFWPIAWQHAKFDGVSTKDREFFSDRVVLATGAFSNRLLDPVGVDSHSKPIKTQTFQLKGPDLKELTRIKDFNEENVLPYTFLPTGGVTVRPDITQPSFWTGCSKGLGRPFDLDCNPEKLFFELSIRPVLIKYFPQFETARISNMVAGSEFENTIDGIPYIFENSGLIVISGVDSTALIKADAIGRIVNALYQKKEEAELFGKVKFKVSDLSIAKRNVERELFSLRPSNELPYILACAARAL